MEDKDLNLFEECAAICVHMSPIANSQKTPTKINKNGGIAKVRILVDQVIL